MESSGSRAFFVTTGLEEERFCQRGQQEGNGALIRETRRTIKAAGAGKREFSVGYVRFAMSVRPSNVFVWLSMKP